jgi:hypothetical protein
LFSLSLIPFLPLTETYLAVGLLLLQNHQYVTLAGGRGGRSFYFWKSLFYTASQETYRFLLPLTSQELV